MCELGLEAIEDRLAQRGGHLAAHAGHRAADGIRLRLDLGRVRVRVRVRVRLRLDLVRVRVRVKVSLTVMQAAAGCAAGVASHAGRLAASLSRGGC